MVGVVEDHHGVPTGVARAILTAFSTASAPVVNSAVFFSWSPGVSRFSARGDLDVPLVLGDHEAGVGEAGGLLRHAPGDLGVGGAHAGDRDPGGEVDELVAVDVDEDPAAGALHEDRQGTPKPVADLAALPLLLELTRERGPGILVWTRRR